MHDYVKKCFRRSVGLKKPSQTYWTVVHGLPVPETAKGMRVCTHFRYIQNVGSKVPVVKKNFSKNEVKKQLVKINNVDHDVLVHNKEIDVSVVEWLMTCNNFIRVWLAHCCSPVLGDRLCGGRVKTVLGKRMPINPNNFSSYQPPEVSPKLLEKLQLSPGQVEIIPPHIHLQTLELISGSGEPKEVITANPPDYFGWTCKQLSLISDEEGFPNSSGPVVIDDVHDIEAIEEEFVYE
ncbi:RNA pseudouridylate synthase domain-containing protein 3 [Armadillidium nasatum]|uniref:RNA pseudouridylate synthase domain-containing protein 3 n=1 Tax=Armadillidium nasatum TaxID=96803 RepID=A0A5N5SWG7_9CRUS|nr:RNA pseudouridylate synthase domain-containing protein 3 [Armadillidium nasatum]